MKAWQVYYKIGEMKRFRLWATYGSLKQAEDRVLWLCKHGYQTLIKEQKGE